MQERFDQEVKLEKFQSATQVLFFYYLYRGARDMYMSGAVKDLGYSAMTISRAAKQLVQTGFFAESKDGVQKILTATTHDKALFDGVRPALINLVRRRTNMKIADLNDQFLLAGSSAAAKQTMLSDSMFRCYAKACVQGLTELPYALNPETERDSKNGCNPKTISSGVAVLPSRMIFLRNILTFVWLRKELTCYLCN